MKIISLINQKGGVGKTTSAISIASYLGKDKKVLLIDLDPQGNATSNSGINKRELSKTIKDLILEDKIGEGSVIEFDVVDNKVKVNLN